LTIAITVLSSNHKYILSLAAIIMMVTASAQDVIPDEVLIDYTGRDKSLREVLFDISEEAEVTIAFQEEIIPGDSLINFKVNQTEVGDVLVYLLDRHHVKYKIVGGQIVLYKDKYGESNEKITISGYITDLQSGESLVSSNVYLYDKTAGTVSNEYGFYSFTLPKGVQRIYYSYLGYNLGIKEVSLTSDTTINIGLDPRIQLNEIIITDTKIIPLQEAESPSEDVLPLENLNSFLPVGGEPDILRLAYSRPGVTTGSDGFGGMSVRGGSINQNLILFDGVPVYNANHLFGLLSIFNANVIKSAKLFKGTFPSHYSGRLSSVLDIRSRDGNNQKFGADISLGLLTAKASVEGPIIKDKASFLVSARRTTVDPWLNALNQSNSSQVINTQTAISFYDINAKLNFKLGEHSRIHLSYYIGDESFDHSRNDRTSASLPELDEINWTTSNTLASLRWNTRINDKSFVNLSLYTSEHTFNSFTHDRVESILSNEVESSVYDAGYYQTKINDLGLRVDFDYYPSAKHVIKFGLGYIRHDFSPQFIFSDQDDNLVSFEQPITSSILENEVSDFNLNSTEVELYIEDEIRFNEHTKLNIGINQLILNSGKQFLIPQPRVLFTTGKGKYDMKVSWGMMAQFLHSITNTGLDVPVDIWVPTTENLVPERAWTATFGHFLNINSRSTLGVEFFYKQLSDVTRFGSGVLRITETNDWDKQVPQGIGESYGGEFSLKTDILKKTRLEIGYTLSWSFRQFDEIQPEKFRFRYDRRHVLNASLTHKFNENIEFSSNFEFGSGIPITIPSTVNYNYLDVNRNLTRIRVLEEINNAELPPYHRLDVGFNFYNKYRWGKTKLTLGVYNAYNRINPLYIREVVNTDLSIDYEQFFLFRILPTFSYNITF